MKKTQIINRQGRVVAIINDDDDAIVPDGYGIRTNMIATSNVCVTDARETYKATRQYKKARG